MLRISSLYEKDRGKVAKAKSIWKELGKAVGNSIVALKGDLLTALEQDGIILPVVDLVFLGGKYYPYFVSFKDII